MRKKQMRIVGSYEEMEAHRLNENIQSSLEERWEAFWSLKRFHKLWFSTEDSVKADVHAKKQLVISKPEWI